jgi:hypothetical protein
VLQVLGEISGEYFSRFAQSNLHTDMASVEKNRRFTMVCETPFFFAFFQPVKSGDKTKK